MKRRDALQSIGLTVSGSFILSSAILQSCQQNDYKLKFFEQSEIETLDEIGETIIPETEDSPGAKFIGIGKFIDFYIADCFSPADQNLVKEGLKSFNQACMSEYDMDFIKLGTESKIECLQSLNIEAETSNEPHYFIKIKDLVLLGYFTSEEGATRALDYLAIPGKYEGDIKISTDHKSWALS